MRAYVLRRLLYIPFMLLAMSALLFYLLQTLPGDAAILKVGATGSCSGTNYHTPVAWIDIG